MRLCGCASAPSVNSWTPKAESTCSSIMLPGKNVVDTRCSYPGKSGDWRRGELKLWGWNFLLECLYREIA